MGYMNIIWADSSTIDILINKEDTYYQKPIGITIIKMTYKSDSNIYYSSNSVVIEKCKHIPVFCNFNDN